MDMFFKVKNCTRCSKELTSRTQSWFNDDVICMDCSKEESEIKRKLRETRGNDFEGCGMHISQLRMMVKE